MSIDLTIIAIVFALVLLLVFFSAVVLYLAFRVKETFRKETRRGATIAKTAFLIGILFLAGGIFYFFANSFVAINRPSTSPTLAPTNSPFQSPTTPPTTSTTGSPSPTVYPSSTTSPTPTLPTSTPTLSPTGTPKTSVSPTPTPPATQTASPTITPTPTPQPQKPTLTVAYPATSKMNSTIAITFTITNPGTTLQGATIQTNSLFQELTLKSSNYAVVGNVVNLGNLQPGTTIVLMQFMTANRPQNINDAASLIFAGLSGQITQQIVITVRGN